MEGQLIPPPNNNFSWNYYPPAAQRGYEFPSYNAPQPPYDPQHPYPGWIPPMHPKLIPAPRQMRDPLSQNAPMPNMMGMSQ